jgi:hypothetical protein
VRPCHGTAVPRDSFVDFPEVTVKDVFMGKRRFQG